MGPRRITQQEIRDSFRIGWNGEADRANPLRVGSDCRADRHLALAAPGRGWRRLNGVDVRGQVARYGPNIYDVEEEDSSIIGLSGQGEGDFYERAGRRH